MWSVGNLVGEIYGQVGGGKERDRREVRNRRMVKMKLDTDGRVRDRDPDTWRAWRRNQGHLTKVTDERSITWK